MAPVLASTTDRISTHKTSSFAVGVRCESPESLYSRSSASPSIDIPPPPPTLPLVITKKPVVAATRPINRTGFSAASKAAGFGARPSTLTSGSTRGSLTGCAVRGNHGFQVLNGRRGAVPPSIQPLEPFNQYQGRYVFTPAPVDVYRCS
jgi:hypothetical protein